MFGIIWRGHNHSGEGTNTTPCRHQKYDSHNRMLQIALRFHVNIPFFARACWTSACCVISKNHTPGGIVDGGCGKNSPSPLLDSQRPAFLSQKNYALLRTRLLCQVENQLTTRPLASRQSLNRAPPGNSNMHAYWNWREIGPAMLEMDAMQSIHSQSRKWRRPLGPGG